MNRFLLVVVFSMAAVTVRSSEKLQTETVASPRNILFIAVDDLNDWVGALGGHPQALTPNMDKLIERGLLFTNAHCTAPGIQLRLKERVVY